jgi:hypothetical protein
MSILTHDLLLNNILPYLSNEELSQFGMCDRSSYQLVNKLKSKFSYYNKLQYFNYKQTYPYNEYQIDECFFNAVKIICGYNQLLIKIILEILPKYDCLCIAGGFMSGVFDIMHHGESVKDNYITSDIDIFCINTRSLDIINNQIDDFLNEINKLDDFLCITTINTLNITCKNDMNTIQIIRNVFDSIYHIFLMFDFECVKICYNNNRIYYNENALAEIQSKYIIINLSMFNLHESKTNIYNRIIKYNNKGYLFFVSDGNLITQFYCLLIIHKMLEIRCKQTTYMYRSPMYSCEEDFYKWNPQPFGYYINKLYVYNIKIQDLKYLKDNRTNLDFIDLLTKKYNLTQFRYPNMPMDIISNEKININYDEAFNKIRPSVMYTNTFVSTSYGPCLYRHETDNIPNNPLYTHCCKSSSYYKCNSFGKTTYTQLKQIVFSNIDTILTKKEYTNQKYYKILYINELDKNIIHIDNNLFKYKYGIYRCCLYKCQKYHVCREIITTLNKHKKDVFICDSCRKLVPYDIMVDISYYDNKPQTKPPLYWFLYDLKNIKDKLILNLVHKNHFIKLIDKYVDNYEILDYIFKYCIDNKLKLDDLLYHIYDTKTNQYRDIYDNHSKLSLSQSISIRVNQLQERYQDYIHIKKHKCGSRDIYIKII